MYPTVLLINPCDHSYAHLCELSMESLGKTYNKAGQQIVFMSGLLPHNINIGYETDVVQPSIVDR